MVLGGGSGAGGLGPETLVLHTPEEIGSALERLSREVEDEVCSFVTTQPEPDPSGAGHRLDEELLGRGIALRMVCLEAFLRDAAWARHLMQSVDLGMAIRTAPILPSRMLVFDRRVAVIPQNLEDVSGGVLVVRHPAVVYLLHGIFESHWRAADRVTGSLPEATPQGPRPMELAVLNLLALGYKDEAIARSTGQSARTVRRVVAALCETSGARSRFDLALRASAQGWVSGPVD